MNFNKRRVTVGQLHLTLRQRGARLGHLYKAMFAQHHLEDEGLLRSLVPEDGIALDVGAHAGQYTKLLARIARRGHVYAIEPGSYARSILEPAMRYRGLKNVTIIPVALSDSQGNAQFNLPIKSSGGVGFGIAHIGKPRLDVRCVTEIVPTTTLDVLAEDLDLQRLDFIKADIEGWELHMLRGAAKTLLRFKPALQIELSSDHLARAGAAIGDAMALLAALGYSGARAANGDFVFRPDQPRKFSVTRSRRVSAALVPAQP